PLHLLQVLTMTPKRNLKKTTVILFLAGATGTLLNPSGSGLDFFESWNRTATWSGNIRTRFLAFRKEARFQIEGPATTGTPLAPPQAPLASVPVVKPERKPASIPPPMEAIPGSILAIGDSMLKTALSPVLEAQIEKLMPGTNLELFSRSGTGLVRPDVLDWNQKTAEIVKGKHFDAVFVLLGTNDTQNLTLDGKAVEFGTEEWKKAYSARVTALNRNLCPASKKVYWIGLPPMLKSTYQSRTEVVNSVIAAALGQSDCARFVPAPAILAGKDGGFSGYVEVNGETVRVREKDGIHLSLEGARLFSRYLIDGVKKGFQ
ncbi:MAG: DUF459 domain-containing protein, partial [Alphaproteobacteria bacterium]|nr:DUF459 domain-containing protein [Alphaproteobacteria bacterium]